MILLYILCAVYDETIEREGKKRSTRLLLGLLCSEEMRNFHIFVSFCWMNSNIESNEKREIFICCVNKSKKSQAKIGVNREIHSNHMKFKFYGAFRSFL